MKIVIFNWRDLDHPNAGGAEVYTDQAATALAGRSHDVTLFTSRPKGMAAELKRGGYRIIRAGSELTCRFHAARWLCLARGDLDVVVDEVNTLPFFSPLIAAAKTKLLIHQLAREVWFAETRFPIGIAGYVAEPLYLQLYRTTPVITLSNSSAETLRRIGLRGGISVVEAAIQAAPPWLVSRPVPGRIGFVGRLTPSKRLDHLIRALAQVRGDLPHAHLVIVGKGSLGYVRQLLALAHGLGVETDVTFAGELSIAERDIAMAQFDVISMTSLREGWGLSISEAGRFNVPAVVYPVPGLIDSTVDGETGLICSECSPTSLAAALRRVLSDHRLRSSLGDGAKRLADRLTFGRFAKAIESAMQPAVRLAVHPVKR